jgi:hypothetical protein
MRITAGWARLTSEAAAGPEDGLFPNGGDEILVQPKWLFRDEPQGLPDRPYVTWTEAVTWIVTGDCWDDDYIPERNSVEWGIRKAQDGSSSI